MPLRRRSIREWRCSSIILGLFTGWRLVVSFITPSLYSQGNILYCNELWGFRKYRQFLPKCVSTNWALRYGRICTRAFEDYFVALKEKLSKELLPSIRYTDRMRCRDGVMMAAFAEHFTMPKRSVTPPNHSSDCVHHPL
jgi:hypothetical protein